MKKIGLIARADNSGLGTLSREFFDNLPVYKTLIVNNGVYAIFPDRFKNYKVTGRDLGEKEVEWFLDGLDTLLTFETSYNPNLFRKANKKGIKTVLIPMYECTPSLETIGFPNILLCPSKLDFQFYKKYRGKTEVKYLPIPVNRKRLPFRERRIAHTFLHNAGHGGLTIRNGTNELLAAIPMIKSDVKILINSQRHISYSHPKLELRIGNFENYWDIWDKGDVFIFPHKFDGLSLPIQEALSVGMPVLTTAIFPFTTWLPKEWMFPPDEMISVRVSNTVREFIDYAVVRPETIAAKIDEYANKDISRDSQRAGNMAELISWKNLYNKYLDILS